jgi:hypothetical protein
MAEVCQKPPVVFEIDPEKNEYAEYKLPVRYWIEDIVAYILSELDHLFGMTAGQNRRPLQLNARRYSFAAIGIRAPDPGESSLQVSALQVVMY